MTMSEQSLALPSEIPPVEYRDVVGFPGYRVGSDGSVWTAWEHRPRLVGNRSGFASVISTQWRRINVYPEKRAAYLCVKLRRDGRARHFRVHALIGRAFLGACLPGEVYHHRDENRQNNHLTNLERKSARRHTSDHHRKRTDLRGLDESNPMISCVCGCGAEFLRFDEERRPRTSLPGHSPNSRSEPFMRDGIMTLIRSGITTTKEILAAYSGSVSVHGTLYRMRKRGYIVRLGHGRWSTGEARNDPD